MLRKVFERLARPESAKETQARGNCILLANDALLSEEQETRKQVATYIEDTIPKLRAIIEGKRLSWLDALFMTPPGFPSVHALYIEPGAQHAFSSMPKGYGGRVDFYIPPQQDVEFRCTFGPIQFTIRQTGKDVVIETPSRTVQTRANRGHLALCWLFFGDGKRLMWVSGGRPKILANNLNTKLRTKQDFVVSNDKGKVAILSFQSLGADDATFYWPDGSEGNIESFPASPFWIRQWEERSRQIWHLIIMLRTVTDIYVSSAELIPRYAKRELRADILTLSRLIISSYNYFPHWRSSAGEAPTDGPWERGNWANGFILGAYGIALGVLHDLDGLSVNETHVRNAYEKGVKWLQPPRDGVYTMDHFPSEKHWIKRSTNHGIVILAAALVGASEVVRTSGPQTTLTPDSYAALEDSFWLLLKNSFQYGTYLEGVRYAQFSMQEAIAIILYRFTESGDTWEDFAAKHLPYMSGVKDFFWLSGYPGGELPYATWGDCQVVPWKSSVIHFFDSFPSDKAGSLTQLVYGDHPEAPLFGHRGRDILKTEPLLLATQLLPRASFNAPDASPQSVVFPEDGVAMIEAQDVNESTTDWRALFLSTRLHFTHNKDHDVGSFAVAARGKVFLGEVPGRGTWRHSTAGVVGFALENEDDPYSCYGGMDGDQRKDRTYGGSLEHRQIDHDISVFSIRADQALAPSSSQRLISRFVRDFVILGQTSPVMVIVTRGVAASGHKPYLNYVFPSAAPDELRLDDDKRRCVLDGCASLTLLDTSSTPYASSEERHLRDYGNKMKASRLVDVFPENGTPFMGIAVVAVDGTTPQIAITMTEKGTDLSVESGVDRFLVTVPNEIDGTTAVLKSGT